MWPSDIEGWTTVAANIVTIVGGISLGIFISVKIQAILHFTRILATAQDAQYRLQSNDFLTAERPNDAPYLILSTWVRHAETESTYVKGLDAAALNSLSAHQLAEYKLYVSRMLAAFDLVLLDAPQSSQPYMQQVMRPKIEAELSKHLAILQTPFLKRMRFPVSPLLRQVVKQVASHQTA